MTFCQGNDGDGRRFASWFDRASVLHLWIESDRTYLLRIMGNMAKRRKLAKLRKMRRFLQECREMAYDPKTP